MAAGPGALRTSWLRACQADPKTVDLDTLPQTEGARADVQYGSNAFYRGVALADVIQKYAPPMGADLALCTFTTAWSCRCRSAKRGRWRLAPLIAVSRKSREDAPYVAEFPPVNKSVDGYADIRQVSFAGNKLVVSDRWHPDLKEGASANFSPWTSTGSLTGIEFVEGSAYYRQFVPSPEHRPGLIVFQQTCQFCHGVRKVGASYGWDYASPAAAHTYRSDPSKAVHAHRLPRGIQADLADDAGPQARHRGRGRAALAVDAGGVERAAHPLLTDEILGCAGQPVESTAHRALRTALSRMQAGETDGEPTQVPHSDRD